MASLQHCPVSMTTGETGWGGEGPPPPQGDERSGAAPAAATSVGDYAPGLEFAESLAGSAASAAAERAHDAMLGLEAPPCRAAPAARRAAPPRRAPAAATAASTASPAPAAVATAAAASGRGARNASWRPGKTTAVAVASTGAGGPPSEAAPEGAAAEPGGGRSAGGGGAEGDVLVLKQGSWDLFPCHFYFEPRKRRLASLNAEALVTALLERDLPNLASSSSSSVKPPAKRSRRQCSLDGSGAAGGCGRGGMAPKRRGAGGGGGGGNDARGSRTAKNAGAASRRKRPRRAGGANGRELVRSRSDPGPSVVAPAKPCRPAGRGGRATRANPGSAGAGRAGGGHAGERRQSPVRFPRPSASAAPSYAPCEPCREWGCGCGCRVGEEAGAGAGPVGKAAVGSAVDPRAARVCLVKLPHAESVVYGTRANGSSDGRRTNHQHHHRHRRHQQHHRHHHQQHHHHQHKQQHSHPEDTEDNEEEHGGYGCRAAQARHPSARPASGLPRPLALYPARSIPASPYPELPSPGGRDHPGTGLLLVPAVGGSRAGAGRGADKRGSHGGMRGARGAAAAAASASAASLVCEVALSYTARRQTNGWVPVGEAYEKAVYVAGELELVPRRCYGAVRRGGDVIAVRDCVLLRSGPRRKCLPYVAKISALWDDPKTGELTMSLLWYYRPEHTQGGRVPGQHCENEVFASRHQDENSVACIEDKCYVLTYLEYCRFQAEVRQREESGRRANPLARPSAGVVPALPARVAPPHRCLPDRANPGLVYLCRRVYDFRLGRILKNPI
ncbi:bromo adjacent homology domain-containing 1 protein-like [Lethenteron reissneri]|uniref:bromo adjacent homology domain-containing 1 protein-like n=1 Tax=Lethenteron reissneri TaxID=7753 RepID=UPI002AB6288C|nr:bromo adjacent homology domain-containing 1 protein-like [Lethenteron reissneri]